MTQISDEAGPFTRKNCCCVRLHPHSICNICRSLYSILAFKIPRVSFSVVDLIYLLILFIHCTEGKYAHCSSLLSNWIHKIISVKNSKLKSFYYIVIVKAHNWKSCRYSLQTYFHHFHNNKMIFYVKEEIC